jgi:hypothetical protein
MQCPIVIEENAATSKAGDHPPQREELVGPKQNSLLVQVPLFWRIQYHGSSFGISSLDPFKHFDLLNAKGQCQDCKLQFRRDSYRQQLHHDLDSGKEFDVQMCPCSVMSWMFCKYFDFGWPLVVGNVRISRFLATL